MAAKEEVQSLVSEEEWALRVHLAACYRLVALYGLDDLIFSTKFLCQWWLTFKRTSVPKFRTQNIFSSTRMVGYSRLSTFFLFADYFLIFWLKCCGKYLTTQEITPESLVKIDLEGRVVMETPHVINPAGFLIHSAIHSYRFEIFLILVIWFAALMPKSFSISIQRLVLLSVHRRMDCCPSVNKACFPSALLLITTTK